MLDNLYLFYLQIKPYYWGFRFCPHGFLIWPVAIWKNAAIKGIYVVPGKAQLLKFLLQSGSPDLHPYNLFTHYPSAVEVNRWITETFWTWYYVYFITNILPPKWRYTASKKWHLRLTFLPMACTFKGISSVQPLLLSIQSGRAHLSLLIIIWNSN